MKGLEQAAASASDKRVFPRWPTQLVVRYGSDDMLAPGKAFDLSEGGIGFTGERLYRVGDRIEIHFRFDSPGAEWIRENAVICHASHGRMGARFTERRAVMACSAQARPKRTGKRLAIELPVSGRLRAGEAFNIIGYTKDISAGGLYFFTELQMQAGAKIELLLPLPQQLAGVREAWALCKGEVVRVEPSATGKWGVGALIQSYEIVPEV